MDQRLKLSLSIDDEHVRVSFRMVDHYELLDKCDNNDINSYYVIQDNVKDMAYVAMHIINGKFAIYDHRFHWIISRFKWYPNNGYACTVLKKEHLDEFPDLPFEVNKQMMMHMLIKVYLLKEPKIINNKHDEFRTVFHHINDRRRDNRVENLMWIGRYEQISILKKGKLYKPPVEVRHLCPELPKYCKWINAKRCYRIDEHPVIFVMVREKKSKHKYIESKKGKKHTPLEKFRDVMAKHSMLQNSPYYDNPTYIGFLEKMNRLETENREIVDFVKSVTSASCL